MGEFSEAAPPGPFPHLVKLGVLGRFYRYVLVSRGTAADWLTEWAAKPAPESTRSPGGRLPSRRVSVFRHDEGADFRGFTVALRTTGERTELLAGGRDDGEPVSEHDREGVRGIMRDLMVAGRS
ncbi:hypothetical protein [Actinacidiphila yeochonensis]|uniref:hypothetical protein n=1 Tax=Actinacidiphila yeochonensis TaxID=89050 RepID=UPI000561C401|nr:hypothetical protein [Actinacidiphila yeochonensis]